MANITLSLQLISCPGGLECQSQHPNIGAYFATIKHLASQEAIGNIKAYVFRKSTMVSISPSQMWIECRNFDNMHSRTKLDKIENFLENESFPMEFKQNIADVQAILFIDQVWLDPSFRGCGLSLTAVRKMIADLKLPKKTVGMLQAGAIGGSGFGDVTEGGEKLTKHWARLGFEPWSDSDDSWLLLSIEESIFTTYQYA